MTAAHRIDWPRVVSVLLTGDDARDRNVARWRVCLEVANNREGYRPLQCDPFPGLLEGLTLDGIRDRLDGPVGRAFADWRAHVTDVEARNAARLLTLANTVQTLTELHRIAHDRELIEARLAELGAFIAGVWRTDVPLNGRNLRLWAVRSTRLYELLPLEWRFLGAES